MLLIKKMVIYGIALVLLAILFLFVCNYWVTNSSKAKLYNQVSDIPANDVALVLGTVKKTSRGYKNFYFYDRMDAAVDLYNQGKVKHFILSGDNSRKGYDEPTDGKGYNNFSSFS